MDDHQPQDGSNHLPDSDCSTLIKTDHQSITSSLLILDEYDDDHHHDHQYHDRDP
jgi:hypothetical protein